MASAWASRAGRGRAARGLMGGMRRAGEGWGNQSARSAACNPALTTQHSQHSTTPPPVLAGSGHTQPPVQHHVSFLCQRAGVSWGADVTGGGGGK